MTYDKIEKIEDIKIMYIERKRSESHYLEYKEKIVKADSVTKPVVAFANADGGLIIFGIEEDGNHLPKGMKPILLKDNQHTIENYILDLVQPKFSNFRIKPIPTEDNRTGIFLIEVNKGINTPYMASNKVHYVRRDKKSEPMTAQEIREAIFRKGLRDALIAELQSNLERSGNIEKKNDQLHQVLEDKHEPIPDESKLHVRAAIFPFNTEAWRAVVSSGLLSIVQEKHANLIKLYDLIIDFNFLTEYPKFDIRRIQTQNDEHHFNIMDVIQKLNRQIQSKLNESLKSFEKEN